jgi:hypothetical protein
MFNLTLYDHLQLTFTQVVQRHKAHALKAHAHGRWDRRLRGSEALLMGGVSIAAVGAAYSQNQILAIVAASLAGLALIILLFHLTFDFEGSARAHSACSAHLWAVRERYRSLLSDLHDGAVDVAEARVRRDALMDELRAIYETTSMIALEEDEKPLPSEAASTPSQARPSSPERAA